MRKTFSGEQRVFNYENSNLKKPLNKENFLKNLNLTSNCFKLPKVTLTSNEMANKANFPHHISFVPRNKSIFCSHSTEKDIF